MSDKSVKGFTYLFAGLALVGLSRIFSTFAVGITTILLLATLFANTTQFTSLVNRIVLAISGEQKQNNPFSQEMRPK